MHVNRPKTTDGDSGLDVYVPTTTVVGAGATVLVPLGIRARMNDHRGQAVSYLLIPRSSMATTPLRMSNSLGLIDAGYRGKLKMVVDNTGSQPYVTNAGDPSMALKMKQILAEKKELMRSLQPMQACQLWVYKYIYVYGYM